MVIDKEAPGGMIELAPGENIFPAERVRKINSFGEYNCWFGRSHELWKEREKPMVTRVKCEYCDQTNDGETQIRCDGCGAGLPATYKPEEPKGRPGIKFSYDWMASTAVPMILSTSPNHGPVY